MFDYLAKAAAAWFVGFFPLAEIYVAVPAAVISGLDDVSVIVWTVFGNYTPIILITFFYQWLLSFKRINGWLSGLASPRTQQFVDRWGVWFVLFFTPWTGVWVMAATAKAMGMQNRRFLPAAFVSIFLNAVLILILMRTGIATFSTG